METLQQLDPGASTSLGPLDLRKREALSLSRPFNSVAGHHGNCSSLRENQSEFLPDSVPWGLGELLVLACIAGRRAGLLLPPLLFFFFFKARGKQGRVVGGCDDFSLRKLVFGYRNFAELAFQTKRSLSS